MNQTFTCDRCKRTSSVRIRAVARDQRRVCAEAVGDIDVFKHEEEIGRKAYQAVMNANIEKGSE